MLLLTLHYLYSQVPYWGVDLITCLPKLYGAKSWNIRQGSDPGHPMYAVYLTIFVQNYSKSGWRVLQLRGRADCPVATFQQETATRWKMQWLDQRSYVS